MNLWKKIKEEGLFWASIFLVILLILNIFNEALIMKNYSVILWYCNLFAIILSIGIWLKNSDIITFVFVTAITSQFKWIYDFLSSLFLGISGMTDWIFSANWWLATISILLHALLIPIAFWGILKYGFGKKSFWYIIFGTIIIFILSYIFSPVSENLNCIYYPCDTNIWDLLLNKEDSYFTIKRLGYLIYHWIWIYLLAYGFLYFVFENDKIKKWIWRKGVKK